MASAPSSSALAPQWEAEFEFAFYHGPDRIPIFGGGGPKGPIRAGEPFHGIVSRGLLDCLSGTDDWYDLAHRLFDGSQSDDARLVALRENAWRRRVLSFRQSALAAQRYLETSLPPRGRRLCDIWNTKEGHTSSVWRVTVDRSDAMHEFILNVARDEAAGRELAQAATTMQAIGERHPSLAMAKVEDIAEVAIDYFGEPITVTVTRNALIRDALEIHLGRHRHTGEPTHVVVERFLTSPDQPAEIAHLFGRVMTNAECLRLKTDLANFLKAAGEIGPVAVDINEGDLVWDGVRAVVVAIR